MKVYMLHTISTFSPNSLTRSGKSQHCVWTGGNVIPKFLLIVKMRKTLSGMHEMLIPKRIFDSRVSSGLIISTTTKANGIFYQ